MAFDLIPLYQNNGLAQGAAQLFICNMSAELCENWSDGALKWKENSEILRNRYCKTDWRACLCIQTQKIGL